MGVSYVGVNGYISSANIATVPVFVGLRGFKGSSTIRGVVVFGGFIYWALIGTFRVIV